MRSVALTKESDREQRCSRFISNNTENWKNWRGDSELLDMTCWNKKRQQIFILHLHAFINQRDTAGRIQWHAFYEKQRCLV